MYLLDEFLLVTIDAGAAVQWIPVIELPTARTCTSAVEGWTPQQLIRSTSEQTRQ